MIVALCVLLNGLDGYDVAAMSFTAKRVQDEFGLSGSELGVVISATLIGMAVGSLLMGYLADRIGRRPTMLLSVALSTVGMYLAAVAPSSLMLAACRVITGLGVGGILACVTVITSEYSNRRWRGLAIGIYTAGYGIGATVGGLVAVELQVQLRLAGGLPGRRGAEHHRAGAALGGHARIRGLPDPKATREHATEARRRSPAGSGFPPKRP